MSSIKAISFLGLGVMGFPMAGHLAEKSGCDVTVYNRSASKADLWLEKYKGKKADTPKEAAQGADIIFLCVGNDDDVRHVLTGEDGVIHGVKEGAVIVDHTTVSAAIEREMAGVFAEKNCVYYDAPVSGGQSGAETGQLTVMVGGKKDKFSDIENIISSCYSKQIMLLGGVGSGQMAKMVNQMCIAGTLQGLSEGLAFGLKAGLDMDQVLDVIGQGAAQSWQMDSRGKTMVRDEFDFGFALDWMVKDLAIALQEVRNNGSDAPMAQAVLERYKTLQEQGHGRLDTSALIKLLTSSP